MFKNFQDHFERAQENGHHDRDFRIFNPKSDRIKLIISAILIPVGCSIFYFLISGHKYAELERAVGDITTTQTPVADEIQSANSESITDSDNTIVKTPTLSPATTTHNQIQSASDDSTNIENATGSIQTALITQSETNISNSDDRNSENPMPNEQTANNLDSDKLQSAKTAVGHSHTVLLQPGRILTELTELIVPGKRIDSNIDYQYSVAGRTQAEVVKLITSQNDTYKSQNLPADDKLITHSVKTQAANTKLHDEIPDQSNNQIVDSPINNDVVQLVANNADQAPAIATAGNTSPNPNFMNVSIIKNSQDKNFRLTRDNSSDTTHPRESLLLASIFNDSQLKADTSINTQNNTLNETASARPEQIQAQSKVILVDRIMSVLKSEMINTNATADAGKLKVTNRHANSSKKSLDVVKLESILEDI